MKKLFNMRVCVCLGESVSEYMLPYEEEVGTNPTVAALADVVCRQGRRPAIDPKWSLTEVCTLLRYVALWFALELLFVYSMWLPVLCVGTEVTKYDTEWTLGQWSRGSTVGLLRVGAPAWTVTRWLYDNWHKTSGARWRWAERVTCAKCDDRRGTRTHRGQRRSVGWRPHWLCQHQRLGPVYWTHACQVLTPADTW